MSRGEEIDADTDGAGVEEEWSGVAAGDGSADNRREEEPVRTAGTMS